MQWEFVVGSVGASKNGDRARVAVLSIVVVRSVAASSVDRFFGMELARLLDGVRAAKSGALRIPGFATVRGRTRYSGQRDDCRRHCSVGN